jgi:hypothetical protein
MRWSQLKKQLQDRFARSVAASIDLNQARYRYTPLSLGGTSAGWNLVAVSPWLNRTMSNGGALFNAFKGAMIGSHLGAIGAIPTAISNSNN